MRIVSLLPSATEILFALGFDREVVGVSHECDFPEQARSKRVVIQSRIPHDTAPGEIDRLVREYVSRGESLYAVDAQARIDEHIERAPTEHDAMQWRLIRQGQLARCDVWVPRQD